MPDVAANISRGDDAWSAAIRTVAARLKALGASAQPLGAPELAAYPKRKFSAGWRVSIRFADADRQLDILLAGGFPWQPARVALVDRPEFLTWPHVEEDGLLCLGNEELSVDPDDPGGAVVRLLDLASQLIGSLARGEYDKDFGDEFLSYWIFAADQPATPLVSLIEATPPSRLVRLWRGKTQYALGETEAQLEAWVANRSGGKPARFETEPAALLWLEDPIAPCDYPRRPGELRKLAARTPGSGGALLEQLALATPDKFVAVLGFATQNGPALAACTFLQPAAPKHGANQSLQRGFRPGAVPKGILAARYFGSAKLIRAPIDRADAAWVHGRGQDARAKSLGGKTVAVIGCGSLGAPIAIALAQAGVARLILIDPDFLKWANIGRHPLGAGCVGVAKAKALAEKLRADLPHLTIEYHIADVDEIVRMHPEVLRRSNLIISATGSWSADARLDAWHAAARRTMPMVYGWTEAHASAGHAVLIGATGGCLACGFDQTGMPNLRVTHWPAGATTRQEPACGAVYQPYGPVELGFVTSLVAELALDALLGDITGSIHRIWAVPRKRLARLGGTWTSEWKSITAGGLEGGFVLDRLWANPACMRCALSVAA